MKKRVLKAILFLIVSYFVFSTLSCSYILNMALIPFAPKFTPTIEMSDEGAKIYYSLSTKIHYSEDDSEDWSRDYAYYIWRSTDNPYNNFELIKRVYISDAVRVYTGYYQTDEGKKEKKYDFTLPNDDRNLAFSSNGYIVDKEALNRTCYYRVSKITVTSNHYVSKTSKSLTYSLIDETSGWLSFGGSN